MKTEEVLILALKEKEIAGNEKYIATSELRNFGETVLIMILPIKIRSEKMV